MTQVNYAAMSDLELKRYILAHRDKNNFTPIWIGGILDLAKL